MIKVLIVDDHEMVRLGVSTYLNLQEDIEVVAEASNGLEGYQKALEWQPDVIVMDLVMDVMDGIESTQKIMADWPQAKIIIVTSFIDNEKVIPALEAGAQSYILKTSSAKEIAQAIRQTYQGHQVIGEKVTAQIRHYEEEKNKVHLHDQLTKRELEVLGLIAKGYSNQEIADELFITLKTVKTHVSNVLSKLELADRTQAAIYAHEHHIQA